MPSFTASEIIRCFSFFETDIKRFGHTGFLFVVLNVGGEHVWYTLSSGLMRDIADKIDQLAPRLRIEDSDAARIMREGAFIQDSLGLSVMTGPTHGSAIDAILDSRLGLLPDALVVEFLLEGKWQRYVFDIVCVANLSVQIRDALDHRIGRESGAVH